MQIFLDDERDFNSRNVVTMALDGLQFSLNMLAYGGRYIHMMAADG